MNIEEAKSIQLEDYLRRMGFNPVNNKGTVSGIVPLSVRRRHLLSR